MRMPCLVVAILVLSSQVHEATGARELGFNPTNAKLSSQLLSPDMTLAASGGGGGGRGVSRTGVFWRALYWPHYSSSSRISPQIFSSITCLMAGLFTLVFVF